MRITQLKKELPGAKIRRDGKTIEVQAQGLTYRFANNDGRTEKEMGEHLRSKIPALVIPPTQ